MKVKVAHQSFISISQVVKLGGLGIAGAVVGVALALAVTFFARDSCAGDIICRSRSGALIGGIALIQAINIVVVYALFRRRKHLVKRS